MDFTDEQIAQIREWAGNAANLSELQDKINGQLNRHLTYMEVRLLLDDLGADLKKVEAPVESESVEEPTGEVVANGISVTVDPVTRPGKIMNGSVTFSDGQHADWHLDELGRLGLKPQTHGYRPSQEDLLQFQQEIQKQLAHLSGRDALGL